MKKQDILKSIDEILASKEVVCNDKLQQIFLKAKNSIQNDELGSLGSLSNELSLYLMTNKYIAPKNVVEFASLIAKAPHQERGKGAFLKMLAMTLIGLK